MKLAGRLVRPHSLTAVEWSTPSGVHVGTAVRGDAPLGHTPVLTMSGIVNVMTVALREYAPTADALTEMRVWLGDIAPTEDDLDMVADLSDADVVRAVARLSADGVAPFAL